jgi:hypothetical protein
MRAHAKRAVVGLVAIAAIGGITVGIADAAKSTKHDGQKGHRAGRTFGPRGTELTGDDATKAKDAALAAVPGGTVLRAWKVDPPGNTGVVYAVGVQKADGTRVGVLLDKDFKLVKVLAPHRFGGPGGPHGGPPNEPELTGDDATKAKDAAVAAVPGGTVLRAAKEDPAEKTGAAYEVLVRKTDDSVVAVLLDGDFKVIKTVAGPGPGGPGMCGPGGMHGGPHPDGDRHGPPGGRGAGFPGGPPPQDGTAIY